MVASTTSMNIWTSSLDEYLHSYIGHGGTAVRLVVAGDNDIGDAIHPAWPAAVVPASAPTSSSSATVDSATTRVHLMDQLFLAVARQVDWMALASTYAGRRLPAGWFPGRRERGGGLGRGGRRRPSRTSTPPSSTAACGARWKTRCCPTTTSPTNSGSRCTGCARR